jgi:positive regulator of sigma E activity
MEKNIVNEDCNKEEGTITKIIENSITVHIEPKEACGTCAIKGACEKTSTKGKDIDIKEDNPQNYSLGERVYVNIPQSKGLKAARLAFVYPLLLIIISVLITYSALHLQDTIIASIAVILVAIYYFILYLLRKKPLFNFNISISKII